MRVKNCKAALGARPGLEIVLEHEGREAVVFVAEREVGASFVSQISGAGAVAREVLAGVESLLAPAPKEAA